MSIHDYLLDEDGDFNIDNLKAGTFSEASEVIEIEPSVFHKFNFITLDDSSIWWNCDGSDLLWGPFSTPADARSHMAL